jgi:hypothetical protein
VKHYYVYYSYEPWGRGYIGRRECECLPEDDIYFGSFFDKTFQPTEKIVLQEFATREEAIAAEVSLHEFYQVHRNKHFANQARQTTTKFSGGSGMLGLHHTNESKKKISKNSASRRPEFREAMSKRLKGVPKKGLKGKSKTPLSEETKQKISQANSGKTLSDEHRQKIAQSNKGKPRTDAQIQAVIESNRRRKGEKRKGYTRHENKNP